MPAPASYIKNTVLPEVAVVNAHMKRLMKELGDAINASISESDRIGDMLARIKDEGYDVYLVLEATDRGARAL